MTFRILSLWLLLLSSTVLADDTARTISVTGSGQVSAMPDRAIVRMSIMSRAADLDSAQAEAARVTALVLQLVQDLDIDDSDVDTTGATVRPDYRWNRDTEEQELRGYIADRQVIIKLEDLETLGELIEGAVNAGVNNVSPAQLYSSRRADLHREALALAARDARANARILAESLGTRLGDPISISDGGVTPTPPAPMPLRTMASAMQAESSETYNAGEQTLTATVSAVFALDE